MFNLYHFLWIGICAAFITAALVLASKLKPSHKTVSLAVLAIAAFCRIWHIALAVKPAASGGMVLDPNQLPFHLCSMQIYLFLAVNLIKNEKIVQTVKAYIAPTAALGGILSLILPTNGVSFAVPRTYQYMLIHALLIFYGLYLMIIEKVDLGVKAYFKNIGCLCGSVAVAFIANTVLQQYDTNFCYLVRPPMDGLPVLNLNNGWYAYIISLAVIALALIFLFHLPFIISKRKRT